MKLKAIDYLYVSFIVLTIIIYFNYYSLNVDSRWILYTASQILEGKTLYIDISEVNPPLIFIYSTFIVVLSKIFSIHYLDFYMPFIGFLILISVYLSFLIIDKTKISNTNKKFYIYLIIFIQYISILGDFGQREHLLIIFIFPYVIFSMFRDSIKINKTFLLIVIVFASLGFNLKPHFYLVFFMIEIIFIFHFKNFFNFIRWDFFVLVTSGLIYILIIEFFFPEFFDFGLPLAIKTYLNLFNKPIIILLLTNEIFILIVTLIIYIFFTENRLSLDNKILLSTIFSFFIIYLIQQKGWFYHRIPLFSFTLLFLTHIYISYISKKNIKFYTLAFIPIIILTIYFNSQNIPRYTELEDIVKELPDNIKVHIVSTGIGRGQVQLKRDQIWASRFGAIGILNYILTNNDPIVREYFFNSIYEDINKNKPDFVILCNKYDKIDYYDFFTKNDKRLKEIYNIYYTKSIINGHVILKRIKDN